MSHSPEISVVIPVYNGARFVCDAIESVFAQQSPVTEVIVVDNYSTDDTRDLLVSRYGDRIRLLQETRPGAAHARNTGAAHARYPWLAFLDADDLWQPDKLTRQFAASREAPYADLFFTHGMEFLERVSAASPQPLALRPQPYPLLGASSLLVRTSAFRTIGDLPPVPHGEFIAWYGWACELGHREIILPEVLVRRRIHPGNTTRVQSHLDGYPAAMKWLLDRRRERASLAAQGAA